MDSTAFNYNPNANVDDGSCVPFIYGCMDSSATNYVSSANVDDGSCTYCYVTANINNGLDSISACDSVLLSTNSIVGSSYLWSSSNIPSQLPPSIGDSYYGGIIFYIDSIGANGIIQKRFNGANDIGTPYIQSTIKVLLLGVVKVQTLILPIILVLDRIIL